MQERRRLIPRQFSLRSLLLLMLAAALVFGIAETIHWNPVPLIFVVLLVLRITIILCASRPLVAVGLFGTVIAIPMALAWRELVQFAVKPHLVQEVVVIVVLYFTVPVASLIYDLRYQGERNIDWYTARAVVETLVLTPLWCTMISVALVCMAIR